MSNLPRAVKSLGQHFLISEKVIKSISEDFSGEYQSLIEVGPGPGALTNTLSKIDTPKVAVEKDKRFEENLKTLFGNNNVVMGDALKVNWQNLIAEKELSGPVWMVSNLPYNVSVPLTLDFIRCSEIQFMTLMMQKEVGEKMFPELAGKNIQKARGSLGALCQNYFDISLLTKVAPGCFSPPPKVDSVVLSFKRKPSPNVPLEEWKQYESFLRLFYKTRRKQLAKVLSEKFNRDQIESLLQNMDLPKTARAETLNLTQVQLLYRALIKESTFHA